MADKNRLGRAAETSVNGFFSNTDENSTEQENKTNHTDIGKEAKRKTSKQIQREQDIETFLGLLRQGKSCKEAYETVGHDKSWGSRVLTELKEHDPDRLKGIPDKVKEDSPAEQIEKALPTQDALQTTEPKNETEKITVTYMESKKQEQQIIPIKIVEAPQKPQEAPKQIQLTKSTPEEEKHAYAANIKPQKAVMGFRAEVDKIELWKLYADASEQEISTMCTAALDEYIRNHELDTDQKEIFDIKRQALEAEKRIKSRKSK